MHVRRVDDTGIDVALRALQIVTAIGMVVALALAIGNANDVTTSRRDSARDSCQLLVGLIHAATVKAPKQRAAVQAYINRTPLRDCSLYARRLVK